MADFNGNVVYQLCALLVLQVAVRAAQAIRLVALEGDVAGGVPLRLMGLAVQRLLFFGAYRAACQTAKGDVLLLLRDDFSRAKLLEKLGHLLLGGEKRDGLVLSFVDFDQGLAATALVRALVNQARRCTSEEILLSDGLARVVAIDRQVLAS